MVTKLYVKMKTFIKENCLSLFIILLAFVVFNFPLPYYIDATGGTLDISSKITVHQGYDSKGSFHLAYVTEFHANLATLIMAWFHPNWDILKMEEVVYENETEEDVYFRDRMMLKEGTQSAILLAYQKASKHVEVVNQKLYVVFVDVDADTELKVGDEIVSVNGKMISSKAELDDFIQAASSFDSLSVMVRRDDKEIVRKATIREEDGRKLIGIMLSEQLELDMDPELTFSFAESETGPSGGLMLALSIYNSLIFEDLSYGKKIVGTGTIDMNGHVGSIGGVKYKLAGAVKKKADLFFVPNGENYDEAMKEKAKHNYDIELVGVDTFDEALEYLRGWQGGKK